MEQRKKCASILLNIRSKMTRISLYDFALFSAQNEDAGLYRVQINRKWHSPDGRWYVWLDGNRLARCDDVRPLTPEELRQARKGEG